MKYIIQVSETTYLKNSKYDTEIEEEAREFSSEEQAQKYINHHCEGTARVIESKKDKLKGE